MKIVPIKNTVVCERITKPREHINGNVLYTKSIVPEYKILSFSVDNEDEFPFNIGDTVIVSKEGDELEIDGKSVFLFKSENVVAKTI